MAHVTRSSEKSHPLVESLLTGNNGDAEPPEVCRANGTTDSSAPEVRPCMKRGREADETAILDAVASWGRPRLKRMRASPAWPDARPAAFAAVVGQKGTSAVEEEIGAAISSWAGPARLGSVLEALGHLHSSEVFKALLASAHEKASRLEQQNNALGGDGLRETQAVARAAQEDAANARAEAASQRMEAERARAEAAAAQEELAQQRRKLEDVRTAAEQFQAKVVALLNHSASEI